MPTDHSRFLGAGAALALLVACGGGGGAPGAPDMAPPAPPAGPLSLQLSEVASVTDAVFLTAPAGDRRRFIVDRRGRVHILSDGVFSATPFLDVSARVSAVGEGGLLSIAFDPQYSVNGYLYLYYTDLAGAIVISRMRVSGNANVADPQSELELLRIAHPVYTNHYGGLLLFGPDGYLYIGTGDGGGSGDPQRNAQNGLSLLGKLLRIDVAGATASVRYAIPGTNPFAGVSGVRNEIWATGLRNPWRYAFDGKLLYIADVGQSRREEINVVNAATGGLNFGWNIMEGSVCHESATCSQTGLTLPAFDYEHGANNVNGCSITGGYVYRGAALPELAGRYVYSDYCAGYLRTLTLGAGGAGIITDWPVAGVGRVVSFGRDGDGELYLIVATGKIYKITRRAG